MGDGDPGAPELHETETDVWTLTWRDGWVASLAAALTAVVEHVRRDDQLQLTDASGATYGHAELVAVVAESTDTVMERIRSDRLTTAELVDLGASAANLAIIATVSRSGPSGEEAAGGEGSAPDPMAGDPGHVHLSEGDPREQGGLVAARELFHRLAERVWTALDPRIRRLLDGRFELAWRAADRTMVSVLAAQLDELLETDDPSIVRLFPPAYGDDAERSAGYAALARSELIDNRRASLETLRAAIDAQSLDVEGLERVMRAVNDLRLMLGTRLGITEDHEPELRPGSPEAPQLAAYHRLTSLLGQIVGALAES